MKLLKNFCYIIAVLAGLLLFVPDLHAATMYACVDTTGIWRCWPNSIQGCQQLPACQSSANPKLVCGKLDDQSLCGKTYVPEPFPSSSTPVGSTGVIPTGTSVNFKFEILPPNQYRNITEVIDAVSGYLFNIAIPISVIMIIYAGVRFLIARGDPGEVTKAKEILKYAVIGLAIMLIGKGFVSLINSVLNLGGSTPSGQQQVTPSGGLPTGGTKGAFGDSCANSSECQSNYCYISLSGPPGKCANP